MVSDLINGISNALYTNFEGVDIYSESIEQGFNEPCFFVVTLNASESPLLGARALRNVDFNIQYFPSSEHAKNAEIEAVAAKLYGVLRRITLLNGDSVNGMNLHHETQDGVLHFFVKYRAVIYYSEEPSELQGSISHSVGVNND